MKSKRAKEFIGDTFWVGHPAFPIRIDIKNDLVKAVELAEQDAEEKIEALKARAVCAFDSLDFTEFMTAECVQDFDNVKCRLRGLFIQRLNER